ncbi:MAG: creatininase family protein [Bryobacteraceae bacterium]
MRAWLILAAASLLGAATPDTVFLEDLTWTEVRDLVASGSTTIIIPTGGTEQNGPHMILGKHNYRVKYTSERIARKLGKTLVAPVVTYVPEGEINPPNGHMRFAGTITLPDEFFRKLLEYAARSFKLHGFRDIVFIGDSGPNQPGQKAVAEMLTREWAADKVRVHHMGNYYAGDSFDRYLLSKGETKAAIGTHAGIKDTSLLWGVDARHLRLDKRANNGGSPTSGVTGDPSRASLEYGKKGLEMLVDNTVAEIRKALAR